VLAAINCLTQERPDSAQALTSANRALEVIQKRQKLIKLADKSEAGWLAVEEYESDELADNSDDEKRIKKAQDKATRKKKQLGLARAKRQKVAPPQFASPQQDKLLFRGSILCVSSCFLCRFNTIHIYIYTHISCLLGASQACKLCPFMHCA